MRNERVIIVPEGSENMRLDKFLASQLNSLSRTKINTLISTNNVLVDGAAKKPSFRVCKNQKITVVIEEKKDVLRPYEFPVKIIYEDKDVIVIDKPAGLTVHPPSLNYYKTLVNALLYLKKDLFDGSPLRPGVVHRLDKETSGVIVLAKNRGSYYNLINQFKERKIEKEYWAIVWGNPQKDNLSVAAPLGRDKKNRLKMKVSFLKAKTAYTEIEAVKRFKNSTLLSIKPSTGRTHQIRVHLKFLGLPIIGDSKYGMKDGYCRLFLHARELGFYHPSQGTFIKFKSPLPLWFEDYIKDNS